MLNRFNSEHWHDEDEVRFIIEGRGVFHVHPPGQPVFAVEVGPGDLIRVPAGTHHWFDLCADRRIRAIRLFQDPAGWAPHYTHTGVDKGFQPVCFGPAYFPPVRRAACERPARRRGVRVVLLDIEGTTTPIAFVHEVLFPFARAHLGALDSTARRDSAERGRSPQLCAAEHAGDVERGEPRAGLAPTATPDDERRSIGVLRRWLMDRDRKSPGLKRLQG